MECSNCNYKIQLDNKFCGNCGTKIKNSLDIEQSSENINISNSDNVPFSFKKWFDNKYPLAPQEFEILYDKNQIDLYEISQIREFWVSVDPNTKMETIKIWENNLKLKNNAVKIDIKNSLDIEQSSENINISNSDNVPFSFKKLLLIVLSIIIYIVVSWILLGLFVGINYAVYGKGIGLFSALGIASFWLSYKFVKWLWKKYFNTHKP